MARTINMVTTKPKCKDCIFGTKVPGSSHYSCKKRIAIVKKNPWGVKNGWCSHPFDFDPIWIEACESYWDQNKEDYLQEVFSAFSVGEWADFLVNGTLSSFLGERVKAKIIFNEGFRKKTLLKEYEEKMNKIFSLFKEEKLEELTTYIVELLRDY